jgi:fermentation-respiration switch protein FrsA (DUF1100 family)
VDATRIGRRRPLVRRAHEPARDLPPDALRSAHPRRRCARAAADILGERFYDTREVPLLLLSGDIDAIVPYEENARTALARANPPVSLLTLEDGTHTGFTGVSMAFEGFDNADEVGCSALGGGGGGGPVFDIVAALGGPEAGIVPGLPGIECPDPLPYGMRPSRQLEKSRASPCARSSSRTSIQTP